MALFVEEVRAAQAKGYKPTPELLQALPAEVLTELGVEVPPISADEKSLLQNVADDATLEQKIQSARESLRAVLEDEIASAQATASATKIDPSAPDAGHQAVRSILNDEVNYEVSKALQASPDAAEALAKLPDLNLPQALANNFAGLPLGGAGLALAALSGGSGGAGAAIAHASGVQVGGFVIDGYVSGATVFADLNHNLSWDEGEPYARTDDAGHYSFTTKIDLTDIKIVSLGGIDTSTLSPIQMMVGALGYNYITPISTLYTKAGGESALQAAGLSTKDLTYDPMSQLTKGGADAAQAAEVLKIGQSLLVTLNNATALVSQVGGISATSAYNAVFAQIGAAVAQNHTSAIHDILSDSNAMQAMLNNALTSIDLDPAAFGALINAASDQVVAVNNALLNMSQADVQAGLNLSYAAVGQQALLQEIQSISSQYVAGQDNAALLDGLNSKFAAGAIDSLIATQAAKIAFSKADASGISTKSDVVTVSAPVAGGAPVKSLVDVLANDSVQGANLKLVGVGLLDPRAMNVKVLDVQEGDSTLRLHIGDGPTPAGSASTFFAGLQFQVTSGADAGKTLEISNYEVSADGKYITVAKPQGYIAGEMGSTFSALISKALPSNITLDIVDGKVQITNSADANSEIGQLDVIYVAQKVVTTPSTPASPPSSSAPATPAAAAIDSKVGLLTVYVQPAAPKIAAHSASVDEAVGVSDLGVSAPTLVTLNLGLDAGALGVNGSVQLKGLPDGSVVMLGDTQVIQNPYSHSWVLQGSQAVAADYSNLQVQLPGDFSGNVTVAVSATTRYANLFNSADSSLTLTVNSKTDGLNLDSLASSARALGEQLDMALIAQGREDASVALVANPTALSEFVNTLRNELIDKVDHSELLAVKMMLPDGWTYQGLNDSFKYALSGQELTVFETKTQTLVALLSKLSIQPPANFATQDGVAVPQVSFLVGSFEETTLQTVNHVSSADVVFVPAQDAFTLKHDLAVTPVSDTPVESLSLVAGWTQEGNWQPSTGTVSVQIAPNLVSTDLVGPSEHLYLRVSDASLYAISSGLRAATISASSVSNLTSFTDAVGAKWWQFQLKGATFTVDVPDTVKSNFTLSVTPVSLDDGLAFSATNIAVGAAHSITVPMHEMAFAPTVEVNHLSGFQEDIPINLGELLLVKPYAERTIDTVSLKIHLPEGFTVVAVNNATSILQADRDGFVTVAAKHLSDFEIIPKADFNGNFTIDQVKATDTPATGSAPAVESDSLAVTDIYLEPVADPVEILSSTLTHDLSSLQLVAGQDQTLYEAGNSNYLSSLDQFIQLKTPSETYNVKLVFSHVDASAVSIKVGSDLVYPEVLQNTDGSATLTYTLSRTVLTGSDSVTLHAGEGLYGKSISLSVYSQDGASISSDTALPTTQLDVVVPPSAPSASVSGAIGLEDATAGVRIPVNFTEDPFRQQFEKVGFVVSVGASDPVELQNGYFTASLKGGGAPLKFTYSADAGGVGVGGWKIVDTSHANFDQQLQVDFSTLTYFSPTNYSGKATLAFTSFAQTANDTSYAPQSPPVSLDIKPVAESLHFADQATLTKLAASLPVASENAQAKDLLDLHLGRYFEKLVAPDSDERVSIEISLPKFTSLVKLDSQGFPTVIAPTLIGSDGTAKFVLTVSEANLCNDLLAYRLSTATNYASSSPLGDTVTITARNYEPTGGSSNTLTVTGTASTSVSFNFLIQPVASTPGSPIVVKSVSTTNESTAQQASWVNVESMVRLASKVSVDSSEQIFVRVVADPKLIVAIQNDDKTVVLLSKSSGQNFYEIKASDYSKLIVRGSDYESGADFKNSLANVSVQTVSKEFWADNTVAKNAAGQEIIALGNAATVSLSLKPIANGVNDSLTVNTVSMKEDASAAVGATNQAVTLASLIKTQATAIDSSETVVYKVAVPSALKLVSTSGSPVVATLVNGKLEYVVSGDLSSYKLVPAANFSGPVSVDITAGSTELSNGSIVFSSGSSSIHTATVCVSAVADAPILVAPDTVSGVITSGVGLSVPVLANLTDRDGSETLSVKISASNLHDGDHLVLSFGASSKLDDLIIDKTHTVTLTGDYLRFIDQMRVSTTDDYRASGALKLNVTATSTEVNARVGASDATKDVTSIVTLNVYQKIEAPTLHVEADYLGGFVTTLPVTLTLPDHVPAGVTENNVSLLITSVPDGAYFQVINPTSGELHLVGASLGTGGVWMISASDITGMKLQLVDPMLDSAQTTSLESTLSFQAFISDPVAGTSNQTASESMHLTFDPTVAAADPLVLSLSGAAISSSLVTDLSVNVDLNQSLSGVERPIYWLNGDANALTGFAFLVKPGANTADGVTLSELYKDFGELVGEFTAQGQTHITANELVSRYGDIKLWFDSSDLGKVDSGELINLSDLPNFAIDIPETAARAATAGGVVPLYEAQVTWGDGVHSSLFAVAIPYLPGALATVATHEHFTSEPSATLTIEDASAVNGLHSVLEDSQNGVTFKVNLKEAEASVSNATVTHLIKVYGVPDGASLSAGAKILSSDNVHTDFWLLTQDQIKGSISIRFADNYVTAEPLNLTVQPVASLILPGATPIAETYTGQFSNVELVQVAGVADQPIISSQVASLTLDEGHSIHLTSDGTVDGDSLVKVSSPDANESLFVQFKLSSVSSQDFVQSVTLNGESVVAVDGYYQVHSSDLSSVVVGFKPFFDQSVNVELRGLSHQGDSQAVSAATVNVQLNINPVADGATQVEAIDQSQNAQEGALGDLRPQLTLSAAAVDAKEDVHFVLKLTGETAKAVQGVDGALELTTPEDLLAGVRYFQVSATANPLADSGDSHFISNALHFDVDQYFSGSIDYQYWAVSVDPAAGVSSSIEQSIALGGDTGLINGSIDVAPVVDPTAFSTSFIDQSGAITSLSLDEDSASDHWFKPQVSTFDADGSESASFEFVVKYTGTLNYTGDASVDDFSITVEQYSGENPALQGYYRLVHTGKTPNAGDIQLGVKVQLTDTANFSDKPPISVTADSQDASFAQFIDITLNKVATQPVLTASETEPLTINDGHLLGGVNLPTISVDSRGDGEVVVYQLKDVPEWLVPSAGTLITGADGTKYYQFAESDLDGLTWSSVRQYNIDSQSVTMHWQVVQMEPSNGNSLASAPVDLNLTLEPSASKTQIIGPSSVVIKESADSSQSASVSLGNLFDVNAEGEWTGSDLNSTIKVSVGLANSNMQITYLDGATAKTFVGGSGQALELTRAEFESAVLKSIDPNYNGVVGLTVTAQQVFADNYLSVDPVTASLTVGITSVPENLKFSTTSGDVVMLEGDHYTLKGLSVTGQSTYNETEVLTLTASSKLKLFIINSEGNLSLVEPAKSASGVSTYTLSDAALTDGKYVVEAPSVANGGVASAGQYNLTLKAYSYDSVTPSLVGSTATSTLSVTVRSPSELPQFNAGHAISLAEGDLVGAPDAIHVIDALKLTKSSDPLETLSFKANSLSLVAVSSTGVSLNLTTEQLAKLITLDEQTGKVTVDSSKLAFLQSGETLTLDLQMAVTSKYGSYPIKFSVDVVGQDGLIVSAYPTPTQTVNESNTVTTSVAIDAVAGLVDVDASLVSSSLTATFKGEPIQVCKANGVWLDKFNHIQVDPHASIFDGLSEGESSQLSLSWRVAEDAIGNIKDVVRSTTLTIVGTNDIPTVSMHSTETFDQNASTQTFDLLAGAHDVDQSDVLSLAAGSGASAVQLSVVDQNGHTVASLPEGSWSLQGSSLVVDPSYFTYLGGHESLTVTARYSVTDSHVAVPVADQFIFTIQGSNDLPVIKGSGIALDFTQNSDSTVVDLLTGVTDADKHDALIVRSVELSAKSSAGETLSLTSESVQVVDGQVVLNPQSFAYLADGESVEIKVQYNVFDGTSDVPTTATLTVAGSNDAPVVNAAVAPVSFDETNISGNASWVSIDLLQGVSDIDSDLSVGELHVSYMGQELDLTQTDTVILDGHLLKINSASNLFNDLSKDQTESLSLNWKVQEELPSGAVISKIERSTDVAVHGTDDAPTITARTFDAVTEDDVSFSVNLLDTKYVSDVDSTNLFVSKYAAHAFNAKTGQPIELPDGVLDAAISVAKDGHTLQIDPHAFDYLSRGENVQLKFDYTISDGQLSSDSQAVFTVQGLNEGQTFTARIIDGYVTGAKVFYDLNGDNVLDGNEAAFSVTTGDDGLATITVDNATLDALHLSGAVGHLVALGGTDTFTGQELHGALIAADGFSVVSPLTTLVALVAQAQALNGETVDVSAISASIVKALGFEGLDLATFDPVKNMSSKDPGVQLLAENAFKTQQAVFSLMQATTSALTKSAGADAQSSMAQSLFKTLDAISTNPDSTSGMDLSARLKLVTSETLVNALGTDEVSLAKAQAIAQSVNAVNDQIIEKYTGLANALSASSTDVDAQLLLSQAKTAAGISQTTLLQTAAEVSKAETVEAAAAVKPITTASINQAIIENIAKDETLSNTIHKDEDGNNTLDLSLKKLSSLGLTGAMMTGVSTNESGHAAVQVGLSDAEDGSVTLSGGIPSILAQDTHGHVIDAANLDVTLSVTSASQFQEVAALAGHGAGYVDFAGQGIDNVSLDLTGSSELSALLSDPASFQGEIEALRADGLHVNTVDLMGNASVSIDQVEANALIHAGLNFAHDDHIALNVDTSGTHATHLSNSLKDLTKLGVDAVAVTGGHAVNVDLGSDAFNEGGTGGADFTLSGLFGGTSGVALTKAQDDALDVTLNASVDDVAGIAHMANELSAMGIDHIDLGGAGQSLSVSIDQVEANALIHAGLNFAHNDHIALNVDTSGAHSTHLSNSLKDLTKLGVDAVAVTGGHAVNVDLGSDAFNEGGTGGADFTLSGLFGGTSGVALTKAQDDALDVTLNASVDDVAGIAHMANELSAMGIDHIDLGGAGQSLSVSIDQVEANALIHAGLNFAHNDHIALNV
ncbi:hypothetical protein, partial [Limnohabitans sp. Jir61]|uniref:hypothetical protein n=1 Tax=Limnohabitans sp. Jir61 TaxID=1826168 RepID=UPI0011B26A18